MIGEVPPAESAVMSCLFTDPLLLAEARRKLPEPGCFTHPTAQAIFEAFVALADTNRPIDLVTVTQWLRDKQKLDGVGGAAAVSEMAACAPVVAHFSHYLKQVWEAKVLADLQHTTQLTLANIASYAKLSEGTRDELGDFVARTETAFFDLVQRVSDESRSGAAGPKSSQEAVDQWTHHIEQVMTNKGRILGLTTGLHELDQTLHGLNDHEGEILVVAARPGMGKTAFAVAIESHFIEQGYPGLVFSLEMSSNQWHDRLILGRAQIDTSKAMNGFFTHQEKETLARSTRAVAKARRTVNDTSYLTTADMRAQAIIAKRKHNIRYVIVDHMRLVKPVGEQGLREERLQITEIMETLQWIKKELKVVVVLLVQMNREADKTAGRQPVMADLAGSASIEHYADHILFLYRPAKYFPWHRLNDAQRESWIEATLPRRQRSPELWAFDCPYDEENGGIHRADYEEDAIVYVAKNRRGPTPEFHIRFQGCFTWYSSRMPCLNSTHPLDQQMGTYQIIKGRDVGGAKDSSPVAQRRTRKSQTNGESLDDVFPED